MKKLMLILLSVSISFCAYSQEKESKSKKNDVPTLVKDAFKKEFPQVKRVEWGIENNLYEAEFTLNGGEASANYNKEGVRKEFEIEVKPETLPDGVLKYIKANYPGFKVTETAKITDDKNVITFEAEITKGGKSSDILFDKDGKFLLKK